MNTPTLLPKALKKQDWRELAAKEAWEKALPIVKQRRNAIKYMEYQNKPVEFCADVLGDHFTDDVVKVMESVRDYPITIARSANATGKSYASARFAVYFLSVYPESQVYITAAPPVSNIRNILWAHLSSIVRHHPALFSGFKIKLFHIERHSTSFLDCVTIPLSGTPEQREGKFSGKHADKLLFIVDEGDAVPEEVYKGIEGCTSNDYFRLLIMFNPRAAMGKVYEMESKGLANVVELSAMHHPNVITGENVIPGAVARETTVRRINDWTRPLVVGEIPDDDDFLVPDFLEGSIAVSKDGTPFPPLQAGWRKIKDPEFFYIVLGKYPPIGSRQLIAEEWISTAVERGKLYTAMRGDLPPDDVSPIIGVDVAEYGGDYNVACLRYGDWVAMPKIWAGMDVAETTDRAYDIYVKNNGYLVMVDAMGIGTSVAPALARKGRDNLKDVRAVSVKVTEKPSPIIKSDLGEFYQLRDQLWWAVREWLKNSHNAMLPDDPLLIEELRTVTYENKSGKIKVMNKDSIRDKLKRSSDRADALCLTFSPVARAIITSLE